MPRDLSKVHRCYITSQINIREIRAFCANAPRFILWRTNMPNLWMLVYLLFLVNANASQYRKSGNVYLNDLSNTPGATVVVPLNRLCSAGYTATVRNVALTTKKQVCDAYGVPPQHCNGQEVEIDHLVSLELG